MNVSSGSICGDSLSGKGREWTRAGAEITASSRDGFLQVCTDTGGSFLPISPGSATFFRAFVSVTASTRNTSLLTAGSGVFLFDYP